MANLIPQAAKRSIKIEYWIRVVSVWLLLLGVAALTLAMLNAPVYLLIQSQLQSYSSEFVDASEQNTSYEAIEAQIVAANDNALLLVGMKSISFITPYLTAIESIAGPEIDLESFQVARQDTKVTVVKVTGVAENRAALVDFSRSLEADERFTDATIPLSNLAKDSDIPFSFDVVIAAGQS